MQNPLASPRPLLRTLAGLVLLGVSPVTAAEAPSLVVTTTADTVNSDDNLTSLREALAFANSDPGADTITFSNGTGGTVNFHDALPETIVLGGAELLAYTQMSIVGPGAEKLTISGNNQSRIFQFGGNYSVKSISGLSILNGRTSTTIGRDNGGGILLYGGELTLTGCAVSGNTAVWSGGGIYVTYGGKLTLVRSNVSGNTAKFGGGIYTWANDVSDSVTLTLVQCTVSGNSATYSDGGGIYSFGGGIQRGNKFTMIQSTVSGNTAERTGAGVLTGGAAVNITQSTVSGNVARGREPGGATTTLPIAGGVYASTCTLDLENCIMANSTGPDFYQSSVTLNLKGKNLVEDASIPAGSNVINSDPLLGPLQNNGGPTSTHALLPGSPAINAVNNSPVPADTFDIDGDLNKTEPLPFDQRGTGFPRANETLDIGAFELPKSVLISADIVSKEEGTGRGKTPFTFTVSRVVSTTGDVTIDYAVTGVAVNGEDFGGSLPTATVTIPDGKASTTLTIEVAKDSAPEPNEAFTVTLVNPNNGYLVLGAGATSTINDDDTVVVSIATTDSNADENTAGTGTWRISRVGALGAATTVRLAIDSSSTAMNADWTQTGASFASLAPGSTGTAIIPAGATFADITLTPGPDIHAEAAETARMNLVADTAYTISGTGNSTITIAANDLVVINTNNTGEGTLRQSILNANAFKGPDTITFGGSTFSDTIVPDTIDLSSQLPAFTDQATIAGPGENKLMIRRPTSAIGAFAIMQVNSGISVLIEKLTLNGGNGGISNLGILRVEKCTLSENFSSTYGGIFNRGTLVVSNSTLSGNRSTEGVGGGIYNLAGASLTVVNSCLTGNSSRNAGGAISIVSNSTVEIINSTVSGNNAQSSGAGISNGGTLSVSNCTITGNTGTGQGGGIATFIGSKLTLKNSIVAGNTAQSEKDICTFSSSNLISSNGANFIGDKSGAAGSLATDKSFASTRTDLGRLLGPLANNGGSTLTHRLVDYSPATNAGNNTSIPLDILDLDADSNKTERQPFDQRGSGFDRVIGGSVDIGSYEGINNAPVIVAPGLLDQRMLVGQVRSIPLSAVFTDPDGDNLVFAVLSNSDESKASATVSGTSLDLKALGNGVTGIAIQASDGFGGTVVDWFAVAVGTKIPTVVKIGSKGRLNPQTGLFEITVKISNTTPRPIEGFRLHVNFDAYRSAYPSLRLENASSPSRKNQVYVDYLKAVAVDEVVSMTLSFYTKTRTFPPRFTPTLAVELLDVPARLSSSVSPSGVAPQAVQARIMMLPDQTVKLVFPSVVGHWYRVRYSADLEKWTDCPMPIQATSDNSEWVDSGPPFTSSSPVNTPGRFYLIDEIGAP